MANDHRVEAENEDPQRDIGDAERGRSCSKQVLQTPEVQLPRPRAIPSKIDARERRPELGECRGPRLVQEDIVVSDKRQTNPGAVRDEGKQREHKAERQQIANVIGLMARLARGARILQARPAIRVSLAANVRGSLMDAATPTRPAP